MVDQETLAQAAGRAAYRCAHLRDEAGQLAPHYLHPRYVPDAASFDQQMADPRFAGIIERELAGEAVADEPLDHLARLAPTPRAGELYVRWLAFLNVDLQPWTGGGAIHFRPHWARVLLLALALGEAEGLPRADLEALCAAAVFHDSRRRDPYLDTGHGSRAAECYRACCERAAEGGWGQTAAGRTLRFDARAYLAMAWHDRDDAAGEAAVRRSCAEGALVAPAPGDERADAPGEPVGAAVGVGGHGCEPVGASGNVAAAGSPAASAPAGADRTLLLLRLFKDADGLDRVRLGEGELDERYLRTPHAPALLPFARELLASTPS